MNQASPLASQTGTAATSGRRGRQSVLNDRLGIALVVLVAVAPIFLGANRPFVWALAGLYVSAVAVIYFLGLRRRHTELRHPPRRLLLLGGIYLAFLAYMVLQIVPLGGWASPLNAFDLGGLPPGSTLSLAPGATALSLVQFATYGLLFFLALQVGANPHRARLLIVAVFYVIAAYAIYGLIALTELGDPLLFLPKWAYLGSATATFVNRNSFATFLAIGLDLGIVLTLSRLLPRDERIGLKHSFQDAALSATATLAIGAALLATQSRMGAAAGGFGALLGMALVLRKAPKARGLFWPVLGISAVGVAVLAALFGRKLLERLGSLESASDVRLSLYDQVWKLIQHRPLTGFGGGSFERAFPLVHQLPVSPDLVWDKAHNTYLSLWADFGLFFGTLPLICVALAAAAIWRLYRSSQRRWLTGAMGLGMLFTAAIHSLADFSLEIEGVALVFTLVLGLVMAGSHTHEAQTAERSHA